MRVIVGNNEERCVYIVSIVYTFDGGSFNKSSSFNCELLTTSIRFLTFSSLCINILTLIKSVFGCTFLEGLCADSVNVFLTSEAVILR